MSKDNNYTLDQIKKNLSQFQKKLKDKNMYENFWVIADRSDFKPLHKLEKKINSKIKLNSKENSKKKSKENSKKNSKVNLKTKSKKIIHSIKELKDNFLDDRGEYYKDKKFANIKVIINDRVLNLLDIIREYKNIANENLLTVQITIFKISSTGNINLNEFQKNYIREDLFI